MVKKLGDKGFITFLLATVILVLAGLYNAGLSKDFLSPIATLMSAILALLAVAYNVWNQNRLADDIRKRKFIAAKASLSVALSELVSLCNAHIKYLANGSSGRLNQICMTQQTKETIQLVIEHAENDDANSLVSLLHNYQVLMTRNENFKDCKFNWTQNNQDYRKINTAYRIIDWVSYKELVHNHFDYARFSRKIPKFSSRRDEFEIALIHTERNKGRLLTDDDRFEEYFDRAVVNKESGFFHPKFDYS